MALLFTVVASTNAFAQKEVLDLTPDVLQRFITASDRIEAELTRLVSTADDDVKRFYAKQQCWNKYNARGKALSDSASIAEERGAANAAALRSRSEALSQEAESKCNSAGAMAGGSAGDASANYDACIKPIATSPEGQKLRRELQAAQRKGDQAALQALMPQAAAFQRKMDEKCGPDPSSGGGRRQREQAQAQALAAQQEAEAAAMPRLMELEIQAADAVAPTVNMTPRQYAIVKERVYAYFRLKEEPDSDNYRAYKFTAAESAALRAAEPKLARVLASML